jgi:hypothetical protein
MARAAEPATWAYIKGLAALNGVDLESLTTRDLVNACWANLCREYAGVDGAVVMALTKQSPQDLRRELLERIEAADEMAHPDPETWGTSAAAQAGLEQALRWSGGDSGDPGGGE